MKNHDKTFSNMVVFFTSLIVLIIDSPFIFFLGKYGLDPNALSLFLAALLLYNQIILPTVCSKLLNKLSDDITLDDVYLVEKEIKNKMQNDSKNNDENKGSDSNG